MYNLKVIKVLSKNSSVVINAGSAEGIIKGSRFLIYILDDIDLIDEETKQNLGKLEIVKGIGIATHVQDHMATIEPQIKRVVKERRVLYGGNSVDVFEDEIIEFKDVRIGDFVKKII